MKARLPLALKISTVAAAAALALSGCGSPAATSAQGGENPAISVQLKVLTSPYWLQVVAGAKAGAETTGATMTLAGATAETEVQEQVEKIRAAITQQVDAIVVAPTAPEQIKPVLEEAVAAGIKVLILDTPVAGFDQALTFIGTDNLAAGKQAGEYIAGKTTTGKIALLGGTVGNTATDQRVEGVKEALQGTEIEVVAELSAKSDRAAARSAMADILQSNPDVSIVFAANDDMALGAVEAIKSAGLDPADITVVGVDGTADAVDSILAGELSASVAQHSFEMGKVGVEQAVKAVKGETIEKRIDTGTTLVEKGNAQKYLDEVNSR